MRQWWDGLEQRDERIGSVEALHFLSIALSDFLGSVAD
jgi:hypothetical protein